MICITEFLVELGPHLVLEHLIITPLAQTSVFLPSLHINGMFEPVIQLITVQLFHHHGYGGYLLLLWILAVLILPTSALFQLLVVVILLPLPLTLIALALP